MRGREVMSTGSEQRDTGALSGARRARFSIAWSPPAAILSVPADTHQLSGHRRAHAAGREDLDLPALFRLDRPQRAITLRREADLFDDISMTKASMPAGCAPVTGNRAFLADNMFFPTPYSCFRRS